MQINIQDDSGDKKYFTIIPNYILNHSTIWDREVYIQMKRIAGDNGTCWTSKTTLSQKCGMSKRRLDKSIAYLLEHKWIEKIGFKDVLTKGGIQQVAEYRIVDLWDRNNSFYQDKGGAQETLPKAKGGARVKPKGVHENLKGGAQNDYKEEPINNIPLKNNQEGADAREVSSLLKKFTEVDPKNKNYYNNITQRRACKFLLEEYGKNNVIKVIDFYLKAREVQETGSPEQRNDFKYLPSITSPYDLQEKWIKLADFVKRAKQQKDEALTRVIF